MGPFEIETYKGHFFDVFDIKPERIDIEDIAHALSLICRFNGHTPKHLSVAEHSVNVSLHVERELRLPALLHDAAEAYLSDVPRPIKQALPEINEIDRELTAAIFEKFGLAYPFDDLIHEIDRAMCLTEARASGMNVDAWEEEYQIEVVQDISFLTPKEAEVYFMLTFKELTGENVNETIQRFLKEVIFDKAV